MNNLNNDDSWIIDPETSEEKKELALYRTREELKDSYYLLPMVLTMRALSNLAQEDENELYQAIKIDNELDWVGQQNWTDPELMLYDSIGFTIGSAFVLGQMLITQSISILKNAIRKIDSVPENLKNKENIMAIGQTVAPNSKLSSIAIIDLAANYFKHHNEWPSDWIEKIPNGGPAKSTIKKMKALDMTSIVPTENLKMALNLLGTNKTDFSVITDHIEKWRLNLAKSIPESQI